MTLWKSAMSFWTAGRESPLEKKLITDPYTNSVKEAFLSPPPVFGSYSHATYLKPELACSACAGTYNPQTKTSFNGQLCRSQYDCVHAFICFYQKCERSDMSYGLMCTFHQKLKLRLKGQMWNLSKCLQPEVCTENAWFATFIFLRRKCVNAFEWYRFNTKHLFAHISSDGW